MEPYLGLLRGFIGATVPLFLILFALDYLRRGVRVATDEPED